MASPRRILLVEDDPREIDLVVGAVQAHRFWHDIIVTRDGAEALDYLYRRGAHAERAPGDPAVVLLDLTLPRLAGLDVLRVVKEDPALRRIPVVVLTASRLDGDRARSYDLGANGYVVKPDDFNTFLDTVHDIVAFWAVVNAPPPSSDASAPGDAARVTSADGGASDPPLSEALAGALAGTVARTVAADAADGGPRAEDDDAPGDDAPAAIPDGDALPAADASLVPPGEPIMAAPDEAPDDVVSASPEDAGACLDDRAVIDPPDSV